jgi:hypothetical protein
MIKYSPSELRVLELLNSKPQSSTTLCEKYFQAGELPFNAQKIIIGVLTSLARKAKFNKDSFQVQKSKRAGPKPMEFWLTRS